MQYYNLTHTTDRCSATKIVQRWFNLLSVTDHEFTRLFIYSKVLEASARK